MVGQAMASTAGEPQAIHRAGLHATPLLESMAEVVVAARGGPAEVAVAGGRCAGSFAPFRIEPEAVEMVVVGSAETHSRRRIFHILGQNAAGRAGNLLVSELRADAGCWSGYPPHKHDQERPPTETEFQEIYHYR